MGSIVEESMQTGGSFNPFAVYASPMALPLIIFGLANFIPSLAVGIRRFHDRNQSGWFMLGVVVLSLIPILGLLVTLAYLANFCLRGTIGDNKYGADPLNGIITNNPVG